MSRFMVKASAALLIGAIGALVAARWGAPEWGQWAVFYCVFTSVLWGDTSWDAI